MPVLPVEKPTGAPGVFERVDAGPEKFGAPFGAAVTRAGEATLQAGETKARTDLAFQQLTNETLAKDMDVQAMRQVDDLLYHPENGYFTKQGKDAVDGYQNVMGRMEEIRKESLAGLPNERAKQMFDQVFYRRMGYSMTAAAGHAAQERKKWMLNTSNERAIQSINEGIQYYNDDKKFDQSIATAKDEALAQSEQLGEGKDAYEKRAAAYTSQAWIGRLERMAVHDPIAAQAKYNEIKDKGFVLGIHQAQLEQKLKAAVMPVESRNMADDIMSGKMGGVALDPAKDPRANLQAWTKTATEEADKKYPDDPVFRDMVIQRIHTYTSANAQAVEARHRLAGNSLALAAISGKVTDMKELINSPERLDAFSHLDPQEQIKLYNILDHNAAKSDPKLTGDGLTLYHTLKGQAINDPESFAKVDLSSYYDALPHHMTTELINLQVRAADKGVQAEAKAVAIKHAVEVAKPSLLAAGIKVNGKAGTTAAKDYDQFTGRLQQALDQFYGNHKKRPTDSEIRDMTGSLLLQGKQANSGFFHDSSRMMFQTDPSQFYVEPPKAEAEKIEKEWAAMHGRKPSAEEIRQVYTRFQMQKQKK